MIHVEKTMFHAADGFNGKSLIDWGRSCAVVQGEEITLINAEKKIA